MSTVNGIVIFFVLVAEGALTRLAYTAVSLLKRKVGKKVFSVFCDVFIAVAGAGLMLMTCLLAADSVRVFYAVFYLGGMVICHLVLPAKLRNVENVAEVPPRVANKTETIPALSASQPTNALPAPAVSAESGEKPRRGFRMFFKNSDDIASKKRFLPQKRDKTE